MRLTTNIITVAEAAEIMGITPRTVRWYIDSGRLPTIGKIGRSIILSRKIVENFKKNPRGRPKGRPSPRKEPDP